MVDGTELTDFPLNLQRDGKMKPNVNIMLGTNLDEGTIFMGAAHDLNDETYLRTLEDAYGKEVGGSIYDQFPSGNYKSPWWALEAALTDLAMSCPARAMARAFSSMPDSQVFLYQFVYEILEFRVDPWLGVSHGSELPFVWALHDGCYPLPNGLCFPVVMAPTGFVLADEMSRKWIRFIATGNPDFPMYNQTTDLNWQFNLPHSKVDSHLKQQACDFFDKIDFLAPPH